MSTTPEMVCNHLVPSKTALPSSSHCLLPRERSGKLRQPARRLKPGWLRVAAVWTCRVTRFLLFAGTPARSTRCERSINGFNLRTFDDEDLLIPAMGWDANQPCPEACRIVRMGGV